MFGQTFDPQDLAIIGLLIILEGVLSIDNALVLGILAKRLPKHQQGRALTYGLVGAFVFRVIAIAMASYLLKWWWVKLLGGGYLIYVALKHFFFDSRQHADHVEVGPDGHPILRDPETGAQLPPEHEEREIAKRSAVAAAATGEGGVLAPAPAPLQAAGRRVAGFWSTVAVIELTDIAFAVDSILAAIAMIPAVPADRANPKLWVVITGGMLGVVLMRFAAVVFIKLLERFPRLEISAYLLIIVIGGKLLVDWYFNKPPPTTTPGWHAPMDFHSPSSPAFWVFWTLMLGCFAIGFIPKRNRGHRHPTGADATPGGGADPQATTPSDRAPLAVGGGTPDASRNGDGSSA